MLYNLLDGRQLLFLHIPKTAGTSVRTWLGWCSEQDDSVAEGNYGHLSLELLKSKVSMPHKSFTIVRNPWDRTVSTYFFALHIVKPFKAALVEFNNGNVPTFEGFVCNLRDGFTLGNPNVTQPQANWITSPIDYILKFENLTQDFAVIQQYVGNNNPLPIENTRYQFNKIDNLPYQEYYNDTTQKIVEEIFQKDILEFGYKFND
jgi:hypothetical protein